ncbi:hypothetical protein HDU98_004814 [Podochytrium sp. JEL0797]|nr:hypothetical protein HDU98_004814 [Podochytrium sp. JEL0797]
MPSKENQPAASVAPVADLADFMKHQELFVDMICHEIRNPLNAIMHCNEFIRSSLLNIQNIIGDIKGEHHTRSGMESVMSEVKDCLQECDSILLCATHQKLVANDVLDLSKMNMNLLTLELAPFSPTDLITQVLSSFHTQLHLNNTTSTVIFKGLLHSRSPPLLHGDKVRITQILINLLLFAMNFKKDASLRHIKVSASVEDGSDVANRVGFRVSVKGSGIGMTPQEKDVLLDRLNRNEQKTLSEYGGAGMGLFVAKRLIEMMGGFFILRSIQGQGSSFSFTIPLELVADKPNITVTSASPPRFKISMASLHTNGPPLILIVDDNAINRKILSTILKKAGCVTMEASDGQQAVDLALLHKFSTIFMDIEMPVLDGKQAAIQIREWDAVQKFPFFMPIVAVTANARKEQVQEYLAVGMQAVIIKPYKKEEILECLEHMKQDNAKGSSRNASYRSLLNHDLRSPSVSKLAPDLLSPVLKSKAGRS